ncbi:hypothetical protein [Methylobacterium sp. WL116]|uniref:hypothetical protein n=1 Tax=Methylobacterium sp. WL116 TaxID=2603889 RepID=UPI0011CB480A|nr:hypothetical protein [Methylobacterium sp. WL116]TXM94946.1 hypothetical protein FV223_02735 [Methylobacterium sp. WL116]
MDAATLAGLQALRTEANGLRDAFDAFTRHLDTLIADETPKDAPSLNPADWKRPDGRLDDQGVKAMEAMFAAGRTVTEIAKDFDITVSAASHRKRIWQVKPNAAQ